MFLLQFISNWLFVLMNRRKRVFLSFSSSELVHTNSNKHWNILLYRDYFHSAQSKLIFSLDSFHSTVALINTLIPVSGYESVFNANYSFKVCLMLLKVKAELAASPPSALIISLIMSTAGKMSLLSFFFLEGENLQSAGRRTGWTEQLLSFLCLLNKKICFYSTDRKIWQSANHVWFIISEL